MGRAERTFDEKLRAYRTEAPISGTNLTRWSVSPRQAEALERHAKGRRVLEIGTGTGFSADAMAGSATVVYTADNDPVVEEEIAPHLPRSCRFINCRTEGIVDAVRPERVDMVHLDGDHTYEAVMQDIKTCRLVATEDAIWAFHDTHMSAVRRAIEDSGFSRESYSVESVTEGPTTLEVWVPRAESNTCG